MVGTTVNDVVERVRRDSLLASRGPVHTLNGTITDIETVLVLNESFTHIGVGEMLSVDYELLYVVSVAASSNSVTVLRGYLGSTAATHADGAFVEVAPRFPKSALLDAAYFEALSWEGKLWKVTATDLAVTSGVQHYAHTTTGKVLRLLDIRFDPVETSSNWWTWSWAGDKHLRGAARLLRNQTSNADEVEIQFTRPVLSTTTARVILAQSLDLSTFASATDLVGTIKMAPSWLEILEVGMKWRALTSTVIGRTDWRTSNVARQTEEVTPLDVVRAAGHLRDLRNTKLSDAMMALVGDWPWRER